MATPTMTATELAVESLAVAGYRVPTETERQSDGTLTWGSTDLVVVEARAGGHSGLGYTYCHPSAARVIAEKLASVVSGADALMPVRKRGPAGLAVAAGEYGWNLPYLQRMLGAGAVDVLQADVSRCGGITNLLRVDGLCKARSVPFSAHCVPAVSAHACCAMETLVHCEYFLDHYRIEGMLFEGAPVPDEGRLIPDRSRPGLGLKLRGAEAERYEVYRAEMP